VTTDRDILHQQIQPQEPCEDLNHAHEDRSGEQIFDTMIADQRQHEDGDRRRRGRDHAGATAHQRSDDRDRERGIKPNLGIDAGNDRKTDHLGDQRKRDILAGIVVALGTTGVAEPFGAIPRKSSSVKQMGVPQQAHGKHRAVRCWSRLCGYVVRRISGRNSHPELHRVHAVGGP
jgi:hypothetical protein